MHKIKVMKFTLISDTHNQHRDIPQKLLSGGDFLIHAGDVSGRGTIKEVFDFLAWFNELPYTHKIFIAGNHDFYFERTSKIVIDEVLSEFPNIIYLNDSGVEIEGFKIWGSPVQPWFHDWAFNRVDEKICKHWDMIPDDTDILITHGGARGAGYLNVVLEGQDVGCPYLAQKIGQLEHLKLFVHGHIHEGSGEFVDGNGKIFVNASILNRSYYMTNKPFELELEK